MRLISVTFFTLVSCERKKNYHFYPFYSPALVSYLIYFSIDFSFFKATKKGLLIDVFKGLSKKAQEDNDGVKRGGGEEEHRSNDGSPSLPGAGVPWKSI